MPFDIGSLFGSGNLNAQQARVLAGQAPNPAPNPNPQVAPGGSPSPQDAQGGASAAPGGGQPNLAAAAPGQTPSQTYAPDPQNGQLTNQMLLKAYQHDQLMNGLSYDLRRVGASFGTAQQQASSMAALGAPPQADTLGAFGKIEEIQKAQQDLSDRARYRAGADMLGQQLFGLKPGQGSMMDPDTFHEMAASHFRSQEPTSAIKDWNQARAALAASGKTPAEVDQLLPPEMLTLGPTADIGQRQYTQEMIAARQAGRVDFPDYETWKAQHAAKATTLETQATDVQKFKDTAMQDYTAVNSKLTDIQKYVDTLTADPDSTRKAMLMPFTTGVGGALNPLVNQKVKDAAVALNKVRSALTAEGLSNVKNVRNVKEFTTLGQAATAGLDPAASPEEFNSALTNLKNRYLDAHATAEMSVGHKLTGDLVGHGNRDLLDPKSPYYNGATEEQATTDFSKMSTVDADKAYEALPHGAVFTDTDGVRKKKP